MKQPQNYELKGRALHSNLKDPKIYSPAIWNELRIFLAVAKNSSFNSAASELGVSQPTVSRAVKSLEASLDQTLVLADQRGVKLTAKGEEIALVASSLDLSLSSMAFHLRQQNSKLSGNLYIKTTDTLASNWITPISAKLAISNPGLSISYLSSEIDSDAFADIELTTIKSETPNVACEQIGFLHHVAITSHAYLDRNGHPGDGQVEDHNLIKFVSRQTDRAEFKAWNALQSTGFQVCSSELSTSCISLARQGVGIVFLPNFITAEHEFVPIDLKVNTSVPFYMICKSTEETDERLSVVANMIRKSFAESDWFQKTLLIRPAGSRSLVALSDIL